MKSIKKLRLSLIIIMMFLFLSMFLTSCTRKAKDHTHIYAEEWSYDEGFHWHKAICEHSDLISYVGDHQFEDDVCVVCGYVRNNVHDVIYVPAKEATCTEVGNIEYLICTECDTCFLDINCTIKVSNVTIPALGHDLVHHEGKEATCTEDGYKAYDTCSRCDYTTYVEIHALGHIESLAVEENRVEATCTEAGHYDEVVYCSVCHEELSSELKTIDAKGHIYGDWIIDIEPTEDSTGERSKYCLICEIRNETEEIPMLPYTDGLTYELNEEGTGYIVTGIGIATATKIYISPKYNELPVVSIYSGAFINNKKITSVVIPDSVTSIGSSAFSGCSSLESITLPFVGSSIKTSSDTYQYPFGYIFGTSSYTGGVATSQFCYVSSTSSTTYSTYYIPLTLKNVTILGGNILYGAFYNCSSLPSITIGDGVTSIGVSAFSGCSSLTSITIPESVTSIEEFAFSGCSSLESITLPFVGGSIKTSNDTYQYPFGYIFGRFSYTGGVETKQFYYGSSTSSTTYSTYYIPSTLKNVTILGGNILYGAFYNCSNLTSITIPDSVTSIGSDAFYNCSNLTSLYISEETQLEYIGNNNIIINFLEKNNLIVDDYLINNKIYFGKANDIIGSIELKDTTTQVYYSDAFVDSSYLTKIIIPETVKYFGFTSDEINGAFKGCTSLNELSLPLSLLNGKSFGYLFGKTIYTNGSSTKQGGTTYYVPSSLRIVKLTGTGTMPSNLFQNCSNLTNISVSGANTISSYAFSGCTNLTDLTFNDSIKSIGSYAFENCKNITGLVIPDSVTSIENNIFNGCSALDKIILGSGITSVPDRMFSGLSNLNTLVFKGEITSIGSYAFSGCTGFESFTIPDSVTTLGDYAFNNCSGLLNVILGENLKSIGNYAFNGCSNLGTVIFGSKLNTIGTYAFYKCSKLTGLSLPEYVTTIGENAFYGCTGIKSITLSNGLLSIGESAFEGCTGFTQIILPNKVQSIANRAFYGCTNLSTVSFGSSVESIGQYAFYNTKISSIRILDSLKTIGNYAFANCASLTGIRIGNGVTALGDYAFNGCTILETVQIGSGIEKLGNYVFLDCKKLANVTLGNVESIGMGAFKNCINLTALSIPTAKIIGAEAFYGCSNLTNISLGNVTDLGASAFRNCAKLEKIEIPASLSVIGAYTFYGCTKLENVILNENLLTLGDYAFYNCKSIKSITIPDSIINIGNNVFEGSGLVSIHLGNSMNLIGTKMFYNCTSLEHVTGGNGVKTIADYAFYNCTSLKTFDIPESVITIAEYAFYNCSSLQEIIMKEGLMTIGSNAFVNCSGAKVIKVPSTVMVLSEGMFKGCGSLTNISLPFVGIDGYSITPTAATLFGVIFGKTSYTGSVAVSQSYTDTQSVTYYVPSNLERIEIISGATDVLYGAFSGLTNIKEISLPSSLENIENNIISGASNLELIYFRGLETEWNNITKGTNWDINSSAYQIRFVDGNLVRVTILGIDDARLEIQATLQDDSANTLYEGISTYYGSGIENVQNGTYILNITSGSYSKEMEITVDGDTEIIINSLEMDILEQFKDREMIVVLTWGENPKDLDSHMTYTDESNSYHIYYNHKVDSTTGTNLDIDDTTSYGPEVITVLELQEGVYRYSIYDYTHGGSTISDGISTSGAHIAVYIDGLLVKEYEAPTSGSGCLWTVFEYNGSTGEITTINSITGGMTSSQVC